MTEPRRILVVDDEPMNVELLRQELIDLGYEVVPAANGEEALELVGESPPDLILLDVVMPGLDGIEVCRRLKDDPATRLIPIVIMTALSDREDRIRGVEAGADDFLTKPVDDRELHARIRSALRSKAAIDETFDELTSAAEQIASLGTHDEDVAVVVAIAAGDSDLDRFVATVESRGGTCAETSSRVAAVFRGPEPADRARDAIRAALADRSGAGLGVALGTALIGADRVATDDRWRWVTTVDGPAVAQAAAAARAAAPGDRLVTDAVLEQLGSGYRATAAGEASGTGLSRVEEVEGDAAAPSDEIEFPIEFAELLPTLRDEWQIVDLYVTRLLSGKSGARVLGVDIVCAGFSGQAILKLETVEVEPDLDAEAERHRRALTRNEPFAAAHLPELVRTFQRGETTATLSTVAAGGLEYCIAWFHAPYELQLVSARQVAQDLLGSWNPDYELASGLVAPADLLGSWLTYRLDPGSGGRIDALYEDVLAVDPTAPTLLIDGVWHPNPLAFARPSGAIPAGPRLRAVVGQVHGDLHGHNLLISQRRSDVADYFLIDLAFYDDTNYLFFDQAYFELSYLLRVRENVPLDRWRGLLGAVHGSQATDADDVGILRIVEAIREGERSWVAVSEEHRTSYMESQMLLARIAAGLNWAHKRVAVGNKLQALLYAAVALKEYVALHDLDWPRDGVVVDWPGG